MRMAVAAGKGLLAFSSGDPSREIQPAASHMERVFIRMLFLPGGKKI